MADAKRKTGATGLRAAGKTVISLWVDAETLTKIDAACQTRYGTLPRTTIIHTALKEFFEKENL